MFPFKLLESKKSVLWKIVPRLTDKNVTEVAMETSGASSAGLCGYMCTTSATCQLFRFNEFTEGCGLYSGVNLREASSEFGNRFYQIMPTGKKGLFHEFSHDILFIFINRKNLCQLTHLVYKVCNSPNV